MKITHIFIILYSCDLLSRPAHLFPGTSGVELVHLHEIHQHNQGNLEPYNSASRGDNRA